TSWDTFFVGLHGLFFTEGTWRFFYSDTLIRLFPVRFWQDAGPWVAGTVAVTAFILALVGRVAQRRLTRAAPPTSQHRSRGTTGGSSYMKEEICLFAAIRAHESQLNRKGAKKT
ncbi:MAG: hypothetical protein J7M17_00400, partial [Anaerolineae bacterium]|nr:hypothetical protein [Anaerolineae bacterium]